MLKTLLIIVGFISGLIPLLDLLLSDEQKAELTLFTRRISDKLGVYKERADKINPGEFSDSSFDIYAAYFWTMFGTLCATANFIIITRVPFTDAQRWIIFFSTLLMVGLFGYFSFSLTEEPGEKFHPISFLARASGLFVAFNLPVWGGLWIFDVDAGPAPAAHFWGGLVAHAITLFFVLVVAGLLNVILFFGAIWALQFAIVFLSFSELVVRRVAEYPKGVTLGASVVFTFLGAALKLFE